MRSRLLILGFFSSISIIILMGVFALNVNQQIIRASEKGNEHFKAIATAAAEVCSYSKRAEGHLLLYLGLHQKSDKEKFPQRIASLDEQISILDQKINDPENRAILQKIKSNRVDILSSGNRLIAYHDKAMQRAGNFEMEKHSAAITDLHAKTSAIRRLGVELATSEIELENDLKQKVKDKVTRLRIFLFLLIALILVFTVYSGNSLNRIIKSLRKEVASRVQSEKALQQEKNKLSDALSKVEVLSGLLPICAVCKKIRDDKGYWNQIESYIRDHSEVKFSHSICPECEKKLYSEYLDEER